MVKNSEKEYNKELKSKGPQSTNRNMQTCKPQKRIHNLRNKLPIDEMGDKGNEMQLSNSHTFHPIEIQNLFTFLLFL